MQVTGLPPTLLPEKEKATEIPLPDVGAGAAPVPVPVGGPEHEPRFQLETFLDTSAKFHPSTFTRLPSAYFGRGIAFAGHFLASTVSTVREAKTAHIYQSWWCPPPQTRTLHFA